MDGMEEEEGLFLATLQSYLHVGVELSGSRRSLALLFLPGEAKDFGRSLCHKGASSTTTTTLTETASLEDLLWPS